jgi:hypothetical protein
MRELIIVAKCSDMCNTEYIVDGETKVEAEGYCPDLEGISGGDYINLRIDLDSGKILGYEPISHKEIMDELTDEDDDWEDNEEDEFDEDGFNTDKFSPVVIDPKVLDSSINNTLENLDL